MSSLSDKGYMYRLDTMITWGVTEGLEFVTLHSYFPHSLLSALFQALIEQDKSHACMGLTFWWS